MRILLADNFPDGSRAELLDRGHECAYEPDTTSGELPERVAGHDVLVVRSTKVTAETIEAAADTLRLVIRAGSGTNTIDADAAAARGVCVCNVPGRNAVAVAELACALLLAIDRNIADNVADLRAGQWDKKRYSRARGIVGRDVGILGMGRIGLAFAERVTAFGADVYTVAKTGRDEQTLQRALALGMRFVDTPDTLADTCDVLSLHLPANDTTRGLVNRELLDRTQPETIILNTARAELIDEDALIDAMDGKGVRAGIDVFADEPGSSSGTIDSRLAKHPNVYGTHHIGASTEQAQHAVATEVVRIIDDFVDGTVDHCVNLDAVLRAQGDLAGALRVGDTS